MVTYTIDKIERKNMKDNKLTNLKGIGEKTAKLFEKLNIHNIDELLVHYPYRYMEFKKENPISYYINENEEEKAVIRGKIVRPFLNRYAGKYKITSAILTDRSSDIEVIWYNSPFVATTTKLYKEYYFVGNIVDKKNKKVLEHPIIYTVEEYEKLIGKLRPVYALTKGISNNTMIKTISLALNTLSPDDIYEYLPTFVLEEYKFLSNEEALKKLHFPDSFKELEEARRRIVFDEFFCFIYNTKLIKKNSVNLKSLYKINFSIEDYKSLEEILSFKLTDSQKTVIKEIIKNMSSGYIMNRLIQGDVGCGKTVISIFAMYACFKNKYQSVIMVPTEVLAKQHFENLKKLFSNLKEAPKIALLTGSMTKKQHLEIYEELENGNIDIIVGTNAVITDKVKYAKLALVITDEQHRFGVRQRQSLALKGEYPHILVMSATPIPRTLAVILYGDMDISIVETKPEGRLAIKNAVIGKDDREKAYKHIIKELEKGHQAYVICAMVEESENIEAMNVVEYSKLLREYFPDKYNISYLHGKMPQSKKDEIMQDFASKKIDLLVSTTVIEVGIDVRNATVMLIEDAQRFGLASLHQLRGRVGRSNIQSYCIFVRTSEKENAKKRLDIIGNSNDGFYIANEDMKLRGPGELFGMAQSGEFSFGLADIYTDANILKLAGKTVEKIFETDLNLEEKASLNRKIEEISYKNYKKLIL